MAYTIYLSGEIHSDWREQIKQGIADANLDIEVLTPITDHDDSDNVGDVILGTEEKHFAICTQIVLHNTDKQRKF
jgi:YtoQ family protein